MSGRRSSLDGGPGYGHGSPSKPRMQLALLKLSTANAFAKTLSAASISRSIEASSTSLSQDVASGISSSGGSQSFADDTFGLGSGAAASAIADSLSPFTPQQRGPYYGMYAEYEDVMELLHSGIIVDSSARRMLSHVTAEQLVHVAHLGIGACCSVDLVAVHCANGSRLLVAAKSCYLPQSDPRLRASLREAELLSRCTDCPFVMQLLAVLQQDNLLDVGPLPATSAMVAVASPPGSASPVDTPLRNSLQLTNASGCAGELPVLTGMSSNYFRNAEDVGLDCVSPSLSAAAASASTATAIAMMMSSPSYQAWAQWRGGGTAEDLEWQIRRRLAAGTAITDGSNSALDGLNSGGCSGSFCSMGRENLNEMGRMQLPSLVGMGLSSLGVQHSCASSTRSCAMPQMDAIQGGCGGDSGHGNGGGSFGTYNYGGGWVRSNGRGGTPRGRRCRRASMEIIDMYGDCMGMGGNGDIASPSQQTHAPETALLCTLLISWARCGDLRRLVQLLLGRSVVHQNNKVTGAAPAVAGLPALVPEDAARFYTGCLVLALEHLHGRLKTVHRDLKLANLLLLESGYVVVGDLGTAVDLSTVPGGRLNARVGSPGHMAPECRDREDGGYDTAADMWSVGACLFSLLTGQLPAGLAGPPNRQWTPSCSRLWSHELQGLLGRLLAWSPSQRPTVAQLMHDPWFRGFNWKALREQRMQPPSSTPWRELLWWPRENRQLL